jgi:hypothetical protein
MANPKSTGKKAPKAKRARAAAPKGPVSHSPRRGLMVSLQARFPESADDKIVAEFACAPSAVWARSCGRWQRTANGRSREMQ